MNKLTSFVLGAAGVILVASPGWAQERVNVRGTVAKFEAPVLTVTSREGPTLTVKLADNAPVRGVVKATLADVKVGSYLGVSAMPQADGTQRAISITIFPEGVRPPESFRPHDLQPGSTMTNATVDTTAAGVDGQVLTLKYKDGEKKITVPANIPIVTYVAGDRGELKPGAKIVIFNAVKQADGTLQAANINVGRDGMMPPM